MITGPVLILGAKSDIAIAIAHRFAKEGYAIQLAARDSQVLETDRANLALRYDVDVTLHEFDVLVTSSHATFVDSLGQLPQIAVCAVGYMGNQSENEQDNDTSITVMRSNYEGPASILGILANKMEDRGSGTLIGISSVAGDRGRAANYIYGSAKAGFTAFLSGLRNRLAKKGIHVVTVLPGFVATKMTHDMDFPVKLTAAPAEVAQAVFQATTRGRDVIYVRKVWFVIMMIIRNIPEKIFKGLNI